MRKSCFLIFAAAVMSFQNGMAQTTTKNVFNHMDIGLTVGTPGIGFDLAMPAGDYIRLRTGMSFMPRIEVPMTFDIQVGDDPSTSSSKFKRMSTMLQSFTGQPVEDHVNMEGKAKMWNWSFLVDVYPLKNNKHWRLSAGFFLGSPNIAEAFNKTESMTSLLAVDIYNNLYDKLHGKTRKQLAVTKLIDFGEGYEDIILGDVDMMVKLQQKLDNAGRMGMNLGTYSHDIVDEEGNVIHKKGEKYIMEPDNHHMVRADMKVNAFKPYIGLGYDGRLVKNNDRFQISVDAGIMFWGGKPKVITHDGTDLINDVEGISGKVGNYIDLMSKLVVFPVANVRFAYTIF